MHVAAKIGIGVAIAAAVAGGAFVVVKLIRKRKHVAAGVPESTSVSGMAAMTPVTTMVVKADSKKMAGRKRHSRWSKLRSIGKSAVGAAALAGVPGAAQGQAALGLAGRI